jgi:hypothetical protein
MLKRCGHIDLERMAAYWEFGAKGDSMVLKILTFSTKKSYGIWKTAA